MNPLDRDDITGRTKRKQPWNPLCSSDVSAEGGANHHSNDSNFNGSVQPKNVQEFVREWRRLKLSPRDQYQYEHNNRVLIMSDKKNSWSWTPGYNITSDI